MPTHSRKHSDATQITKEILKDAAKPTPSCVGKRRLRKEEEPCPCRPGNAGWEQGRENSSR